MVERGSEGGASLSGSSVKEPAGRDPLLGILKDM